MRSRVVLGAVLCLGAASAQSPSSLAVVNAADYVSQIAPGSIAAAFGVNLPVDASTGVNVCSPGCVAATVIAALPTQINFLVPEAATADVVTVQVTHSGSVVAAGTVPATSLSPAIFTADESGTGIFNGQSFDQGQYNAVFIRAGGALVPRAVQPPNTLVLYGTGWKRANLSTVRVSLNGTTVNADYAGPTVLPGLDQLNVQIPSGLVGQAAQMVDVSVSFGSEPDSTTGAFQTRVVEFCLAGQRGDQNCPAVPPVTPSCTEPLPFLATPYAPHGIFMLQFPGANPVPITNYIQKQPAVCGADLYVVWNTIDSGNGNYDWSALDRAIGPWVQVGKQVNLIVWGVSDARPNNATPAYVVNDPSYQSVTCQENGQTLQYPVYYTGSYKTYYKAFVQAVMNRYGPNGNIGYIRFGLARGGEVFPTCLSQMMTYSGAATTSEFNTIWQNYIMEMTAFQKSMHTAILNTAGQVVQLMAAINQYGSPVQYPPIMFEAANAKGLGFGFGSQGLQLSDITAYQAGRPCGSDWCNQFLLNYGAVPLELQTIAASDPANAPGGTGSLTVLLPFALSLHTQILEVYVQDLQVAYDPTSASYSQYGQAYRQLFDQVAGVLGYAPRH
jgi:uncharacterized protein (TIGR03437 family)